MRGLKRFALLCLVVLGLFWAPWAYLYLRTEVADFTSVQKAETAIVFGALVRNGAISPLHEERLLSAKRLVDDGAVEQIVLSNSARAANFMVDYMKSVGVDEALIDVDGAAIKTSDTCDRERDVGEGRSVVLISQSFHLPRLAYQCSRVGVTGQYLAAEKIHASPRVGVPLWTKIRVRGHRYFREAALTWTVLFGVYDRA